MKRMVLLSLLLAGCGTPDSLPASRNADGSVYIAPVCRAHEAELKALNVPVRDMPRELMPGADGQYVPSMRLILIRAGLTGWYREDVELHERCHAWLHATTGNPVFHK
jgi:hypothetical protein